MPSHFAFKFQSNKFLEDVISRPWTLSTSQQPQQQIQIDMPDINLEAFRKMVSYASVDKFMALV